MFYYIMYKYSYYIMYKYTYDMCLYYFINNSNWKIHRYVDKVHNPSYVRFLLQYVCILYVLKNKMLIYHF